MTQSRPRNPPDFMELEDSQSTPFLPILSHMNPIHTLVLYFFKSHCIITVQLLTHQPRVSTR